MSAVCETCRSPEAEGSCKLCGCALCEDCVMAPPHGTFSLLAKVAPELSHSSYCRFCYDEKIEPEVLKYEETLAKAKEVFIFFKTQKKEIPLIKKTKEIMKVEKCDDRDETILRLAFMSTEKGFNAVIETDVNYAKIRNEGYQKTQWSGTGIAAQIDGGKLDSQDRANQIYR